MSENAASRPAESGHPESSTSATGHPGPEDSAPAEPAPSEASAHGAEPLRAHSMGQLFLDRVARTPKREAFRYPVGEGWGTLTWEQTGVRVRELAAGLLALGVESEQRVAIASGTRLEWILADLAIMCAGAATTTVYPLSQAKEVAYILRDSQSRVAFVEDEEQADKILAHRADLPDLTHIVQLIGSPAEGSGVLSLDELARRGRAHLQEHPEAVDAAVAATRADSLATLIYTSGTTGTPKGVRLSQANWLYEGEAIDALGILSEEDLQYLWLPLAHSFGKVLESAQIRIGFSTAVDGRVTHIIGNLATVQPTFMAAVPRIFEKAYAAVRAQATGGGLKPKIASWAFGVGREMAQRKQDGRAADPLLLAQHAVADHLVFSKVRARFGGRIRYFISGSAALSKEIALFFDGAGLPILEGYGLTETSAFTFVNRPESYRFGTVGLPAPGTEVRIADDGEILVKGPGVMSGYHGLPEETRAVFSDDGWFTTGDIGQLAGEHLAITDRKKDLIKTSVGKYVAPQSIEITFKTVCPYASQIVVHGDGRNFCSALITLDPDGIARWAADTELAGKPYAEIVTSPQVRSLVEGYVSQMNERLPKWERIRKFAVLPQDLSVEDGDLTPSLKVKRRAVEKKYADLLNQFYEGASD